MKKWLILLLILPALCLAGKPNPPWEEIRGPNNKSMIRMYRMSVPHGWIVHTLRVEYQDESTTTFIPDENHEWVLEK